MNMLKDHTIVYDHECPMCNIYTNAFVKHGFLDKSGRKGFNELTEKEWSQIDQSKSFNEIPLINTQTGEVTYGIESLFKILANRFPAFHTLFKLSWFRWMMQYFYSFISYNRKAIAPGSCFEKADSCAPSFNLNYRLAYLVFTWLITALILTSFAHTLTPIVPTASFSRELLIAGGQMVFLGSITLYFDRTKVVYYLGNLMTISLIGSLLLVPIIWISQLVNLHIGFLMTYFAAVVLFMIIEHKRRLKILELPMISLSTFWILYRLMVLLLII